MPTEETINSIPKNIILYGPPGTGKTYHTAIYAVAIIENKPLADIENEPYEEIARRYNEYKAAGLVEFTTFHQSYGYEEFIEGIKPVMNNSNGQKDIEYEISSGLFKNFCERASQPIPRKVPDIIINSNAKIWKVSLNGTGNNAIRTECMKNGHIRIGFDSYGENITNKTDFSIEGGKIVLKAFIYRMEVGDIVLSCSSLTTIDAIGVITGKYEWHDEYKNFKRLRKVNWIVKGISENIAKANGSKKMTLSAVHELKNMSISDVKEIIKKHLTETCDVQNGSRNHVFIIDEINRGNISKIFGELITLIEPTKRIGQTEETSVKLPYSQKAFGVPNNVYLIGTMNTADRSIATIDTALRRRFYFQEMQPNPTVLEGVFVEDVSIKNLLARMNLKISVLYDREHTIGHAYFTKLKEDPNIKTLASIFKNNIIPLLQEYFYEDYEKIRLVLGDNKKQNEKEQFITAKAIDYTALFGSTDLETDDTFRYEINPVAFDNIEAYRYI